MSNWFAPMTYDETRRKPEFFWLTQDSWFPSNSVVETSEKGSNEMRLIRLVIENVNNFVRTILPESTAYCLTLDGHRSRNGYAWLDFCRRVGCEVVQLPSDTTHFLQPCDRTDNKVIKQSAKKYRDKLAFLGSVNLGNYSN